MPRARKFGGLPTLTPKVTLTLRKTLSPPHVPPNGNVHPVANALYFSRPPPIAANDLLSPPTSDTLPTPKQNVLI